MSTPTIRTALSIATVLGATVIPASAQSPAPVTLKAPDGITLKATYYPAAKPGPGLVLLHQCNRDRSAWAPFAKAASARGYHVIAMDYRGYGESEGQRFESFQEQAPVIAEKWPGDVDAAFAWLIAQPGVDKDRIGAAGASCGVNQSVQLARRHPEVKTVMLLSGGVTPDGREYLRQSSWLPVLASASHDDGNALESMRWILGWSRHPSNRLVEYQAAGHGTDMFGVEKGLEPLMLDWVDAHLRNARAKPSTTSPPMPPTPIEEFWTTLTQPGGASKARQLFDDARKRNAKVVLFPEGEANAYGYQLLQSGKPEEAVIVFQMNADAYPESANTYDSLSDAYLAAGKPAEAVRFAEKALKVLATDTKTPEQFKVLIRESAQKKISELKKS
ncbi:MAG TPA: alpha/beta fold hydrolase [Vicinamibacterales bacterium]|nr:alpha/beta fold hydrolase [Vicinamibacterales bacterium]